MPLDAAPLDEAPRDDAPLDEASQLASSPDAPARRTLLRLHKIDNALAAAFGVSHSDREADVRDEAWPAGQRGDSVTKAEQDGASSAGLRPPLAGHGLPLAGDALPLAGHALPPASAARPTALQVHNRYLIAETGQGVLVIDQHALHERILYEQLRAKVLAGALECQSLLVPEPVHLSPAEAAAVLEEQELLARLGVRVEPFGGDTVLVTSYPAMLAKVNLLEMLRAIVERLLAGGKALERRDLVDELLHMMSCKAAVKAGDRAHARGDRGPARAAAPGPRHPPLPPRPADRAGVDPRRAGPAVPAHLKASVEPSGRRVRNIERPTLNVQRPTSNISRLDVRCWTLDVGRSARSLFVTDFASSYSTVSLVISTHVGLTARRLPHASQSRQAAALLRRRRPGDDGV